MTRHRTTIALVDGAEGGHHLTHMRNYAAALLALGYRVIELVPAPDEVTSWLQERAPDHLDRIRLLVFRDRPIQSPLWKFRNLYVPLERWRRVHRGLKRVAAASGFVPDLVFFCWLDAYILGGSRRVASILPLVFPHRWSGMYFHPWHLRIDEADGREALVATEDMLRSRGCRSVAVLDEGIALELEQHVGRPVIPFPDETNAELPEEVPPLVTRVRKEARSRKIIGLLGRMTRRKGVLPLLRVARACADRPWMFVLAGEFNDVAKGTYTTAELAEVDRLVSESRDNVFFYDQRIDDERDFNALFRTCHVIFAAYEQFAHSSGLLTKAAFFERPVIVSRGFCMEEQTEKYGLGLTVEETDEAMMIDALTRMTGPEPWYAPNPPPDYEAYRRAHSMDRLRECFEDVAALA